MNSHKPIRTMWHKGFLGHAYACPDDGRLYGRACLQNMVAVFSGDSLEEIEKNFQRVVEGCLDFSRNDAKQSGFDILPERRSCELAIA